MTKRFTQSSNALLHNTKEKVTPPSDYKTKLWDTLKKTHLKSFMTALENPFDCNVYVD